MFTKRDELKEYMMQFAELSQPVKDKLLEQAASMLDYQWWDHIYDDFVGVAECFGLGVTSTGNASWKIHFSGFWSQGDGACFGAVFDLDDGIDAVEKIAEYAPQDPVLAQLAERMHNECAGMMGVSELLCFGMGLRLGINTDNSNYCHSQTMKVNTPSHTTLDFDGNESEGLHEAEVISRCDLFDREVLGIARELANWLYNQLQKEYERLCSEECIAERGIDYDEEGVELEEELV